MERGVSVSETVVLAVTLPDREREPEVVAVGRVADGDRLRVVRVRERLQVTVADAVKVRVWEGVGDVVGVRVGVPVGDSETV